MEINNKIESAVELNDNDLDSVIGGMGTSDANDNDPSTRKCPGCNKIVKFILHSGGRASCPNCGEKIMM